MSFSIPHQIEQDIIAGRAVYRTFQTGNGGQSILQVPTNSYAVIYGYDFSPAGGGLVISGRDQAGGNDTVLQAPGRIAFFETQQISFFTGSDFFPFIHHVNAECTAAPIVTDASNPALEKVEIFKTFWSIDNSPISRQVYITSSNDVTITHGCIQVSLSVSQNAIPITNRTPQALSYGGSALIMNTQTNYGPGGTPLQFMQPSPKDFQDFAFGLLPGNADSQAFATPDGSVGLIPSNALSASFGTLNAASQAYYLCLHYALYSAAIPEPRG